MAYELTLTKDERNAIDWVGYRYGTGDDLFKTLMRGNPNHDWDFAGDVSFQIPEHVAWQIRDLCESEDFLFPCFSPEFAGKLQDFCDKIV